MMRLLIAIAMLGCGGEPITEIYACYSIDDEVTSLGPTVTLEAYGLGTGETLYNSQVSLAAGSSILTQGFVQEEAEGVRLILTATIERSAAPDVVFSQEAVVLFQSERIVDLALRLESACQARTCAAGETCVEGECVAAEVSVSCLMDHNGSPTGRLCDSRSTTPCPDL